MIIKKNHPTIKGKLWRNVLWSPSYSAGSCSGTPISIIQQYIEQQKTPD
ncbi:transposase IS200-like domain protein [Providencia alcalifaciens RIMD 1656011]|nr:transposase IS200-like domain protein [Providencia alcalifaciens RIMD 1656011]